MNNFFANKNNLLYAFAFTFPVILSCFLILANHIFWNTGININPSGIGNVEWFIFFGSYVAGVFTLIAFIRTSEENKINLQQQFEENKNSLSLQFNENKKALLFQAEISEIEKEASTISEIVEGLQVRDLFDIVSFYHDTNKTKTFYDDGETIRISQSIIDRRRQVLSLQVKFLLETKTNGVRCKTCKNRELCELGKLKIEFTDLFYFLYDEMYKGLSISYRCIQVAKQNADWTKKVIESGNESIIREGQLDIANDEYQSSPNPLLEEKILLLQESITRKKEHIDFYESQINKEKEKELWAELDTFLAKIEDLEKKGLAKLFGVSHSYIIERKNSAKRELNSEKNYTYEEDKNAIEALKGYVPKIV